MKHILKRITRGLLISLLAFVILHDKGALECQLAKYIAFCEKCSAGPVESILATGALCLIIATLNAAIGASIYLAFSAFFNMDSTRRQPSPWVVLFLAVFITKLLQDLDSHHCTPLLEISKNICIIFVPAAVYAIYTFKYGGAERPALRWNWLTISMVASPWLFAGSNYFLLTPSVTTLAFPLAVLRSLAIGIHEELPFRGILFRAYQGRNMVQYVLVSSIAFGLIHWQLGCRGVLNAAVLGCSLAMARVAGAPLILLIACHALLDFKIVQVGFDTNLFTAPPQHQFSFMVNPQLQYVYNYSVSGLVSLIPLLIVLALLAAFLIRREDWMPKVADCGGGVGSGTDCSPGCNPAHHEKEEPTYCSAAGSKDPEGLAGH